jgi:catechol 2,3-dioxygenase-like lactoylglutathione lyase family enzyme
VRFHQHVCFTVADMDRAARFYVDGLGGAWLNKPYELSGPEIEQIFPLPGLRLRVAHIGWEGGSLELLQFTAPNDVAAASPSGESPTMAPHFGLWTEEIEQAYEAVQAAGGRILTELQHAASLTESEQRVFFCADPDGNVVEVLNFDMSEVVRSAHELFPESDPDH